MPCYGPLTPPVGLGFEDEADASELMHWLSRGGDLSSAALVVRGRRALQVEHALLASHLGLPCHHTVL